MRVIIVFGQKIFDKTQINIDVSSGKTYIVKCGVQGGPILKPKMTILTEKEIKKEINKAYLKKKFVEHNIKI